MTTNPTLLKKLGQIQAKFKTFATSEESATKNGAKSSYNYTPGWQIVEKIREEMDNNHLMLISSLVSCTPTLIEYPVWKDMNGQIVEFRKKEMYVSVIYDFTWMDTDSGEQLGPIRYGSGNSNGIDKSFATAISTTERYFLLKFFHITTREKGDEMDAHDESVVAGINPSYQNVNFSKQGGGNVVTAAPAPTYGIVTPPQQSVPVMQAPAQPTNDPYINAARELANFAPGTESFNKLLNAKITALNIAGFNTSDPLFKNNLVDYARNIREGRAQ